MVYDMEGSVVDTTSLPFGWEVNAQFSFLVLDQLRDKYLSIQDGTIRRYHESKAEWGVLWDISLMTVAYPGQKFSSSKIAAERNACPW
ncbi:hypothetical protein GOBAR_DD32947 [Gossypium barbadense]|nr:hypothetical protein GOBAR_DD32947 [Gossypium barbadense]